MLSIHIHYWVGANNESNNICAWFTVAHLKTTVHFNYILSVVTCSYYQGCAKVPYCALYLM